MKKFIFVFIALLSVIILPAQERNIDNRVEDKKEHIALHMTTTFGQDYFANNFFINTFGVDYSKQLNNKTTLYLGANVFNVNTAKELSDFAPRRKNAGAMYMGLSYKANENVIISGEVFYNGLFNIIGADLDLKVLFGENSFLEISASFARQLSPSGYHYPVPYWNNHIFQPFVFGY